MSVSSAHAPGPGTGEAFTSDREASQIQEDGQADRGPDIEKGSEGPPSLIHENGGSGSPSDEDQNTVWWNGLDDPENPLNWSQWKTGVNCALISAITLITPLGSSIFAPAVPQVMEEFENDSEPLASFVVSVYVLGFAAGPLLIAPLSEIYGRSIVYHVCNVGFLAFVIACAVAPSLSCLIAFRFFCGVFGSCPLTNGGGSVADMVPQEKRGLVMSMLSIGPLFGPIIGAIGGGALAGARGWRWTFWLLAIIDGAVAIAMYFFMRETYAPVILRRRAEKLRKETGNASLRSKLDSGMSPHDFFAYSIIRPFRMLIFSPVVSITAFYIAIIYGYLYIMLTSISEVFIDFYGFTTSTVGLVFLGLGVGSLAGSAYFSVASDRHIKRKAAEADARAAETGIAAQGMKPEYRLQPLFFASALLPNGFFIYGWTTQYHVHWIVPIIGTAIIGAGNILCFMALQMYLVDSFTIYAASALAANTVVRSIFGAVLPLCGLQMYSVLGMGWGNSLLAFIALAMLAVVIYINRYGETLRKKYDLKKL